MTSTKQWAAFDHNHFKGCPAAPESPKLDRCTCDDYAVRARLASHSSSASEITEALNEFQACVVNWTESSSGFHGPVDDLMAARSRLESIYREQQQEIERLRRFETYVCQVIAMGNQADLTVESLPK